MIEIVDATEAHGEFIAENMRELDRQEAARTSTEPLDVIVREAMGLSTCKWTILVDAVPVLMMGAAPTWVNRENDAKSRAYAVWIFGTEDWPLARRALIRDVPGYIAKLFLDAEVLFGWISSESHDTIRWLSWLGFTVYPPDPKGPRGEETRQFMMWRHEYA